MKSIKELMLEEHKKIENFLKKFQGSLKADNETLEKQFDEFKRELESHFTLEEKAIFDIYNNLIGEEVEDIFKLMQEHGNILGMIERMKKEIENREKPNVDDLKQNLIEHADFENQTFYPKLDKELSENQKQEIITKINELKQEF